MASDLGLHCLPYSMSLQKGRISYKYLNQNVRFLLIISLSSNECSGEPGQMRLHTGADPGFLERGFMCIKGWGFALLILSRFS